ncbi:NAD(P)H-binding protein [Streptomyces sp. NPDC048172]|uniref:NAD(P)H-binding protein n=1 Tax=Streptomyces sp. NPDC048172 TaxID=3365505 RepID=UPI003723D769
MHLITGATGNVGRPLVELLVAAGAPVRALSRDPEKAAAALPASVEAVRDGAEGPGTFPLEALEGVRTVFVNHAAVGDRTEALLRQAAEHGVRDVVLLSTAAALDEANPVGAHHRELERLVRESGLRWTALRPGVFHSNALAWAEGVRTDGTVRAPYGAARVTPVDERDIAAVAARALLDGLDGLGEGSALAGRTPVLSGPEQLSTEDQVRILGEALGRPVRFEELDPGAWRAGLVAAGVPEWVADGLAGHYARAAAHPVEVSPVVEEVTGRPPRPFAEWAAAHAAAFGGASAGEAPARR